MFTFTFLITACAITALATWMAALRHARRSVESAREEERQRSATELAAVRDAYEFEVRELQQSLARDIAALEARSRKPLRTLVDSLLSRTP